MQFFDIMFPKFYFAGAHRFDWIGVKFTFAFGVRVNESILVQLFYFFPDGHMSQLRGKVQL